MSYVLMSFLGSFLRNYIVPIHEIEQNDTKLLSSRSNRTLQEYIWTRTPSIILRVFEEHSSNGPLIYLDADMLFYSSVEPIFTELADQTVLIHKHRFAPRLSHLEKNGTYNVGLIAFNRNEESFKVLNWWRDRCIEWCHLEPKDGKMGDQGYLNDWPTLFKGVVSSENIGIGVAPWNIEQYAISVKNSDVPLVDNTQIVFYHYHDFKFANPLLIVPCSDTGYRFPPNFVELCLLPYANQLLQSYLRVRQIIPEFENGLNSPDVLTGNHTFLVHRTIENQVSSANVPQRREYLNGADWIAYTSLEQSVHRAS